MALSLEAMEGAVKAAQDELKRHGLSPGRVVLIVDTPDDVQVAANPENLYGALEVVEHASAVLRMALASWAQTN